MTPLFRLVVALVAGAGLAAFFGAATVVRDSQRGVVTPGDLGGAALAMTFFTVVGGVLLVSALGLALRQAWGRIGALAVALALLPPASLVAAIFGAMIAMHEWGGPTESYVPAMAAGLAGVVLACLLLGYYLSFGPGRRAFTGRTGLALGIAGGLAAAAYVPGFLTFAVLPVAVGNRGGANGPGRGRPAAELAADLGKVCAHVPDARDVALLKCPDAEIVARAPAFDRTAWFGGQYVWVMPVLQQVLARFQASPPAAPAYPDWAFASDHSFLDDIGADTPFARHLSASPYVAVLGAAEGSLPRLEHEGGPAESGNGKVVRTGVNFRPGLFRGGVFIMDIRTAAVVCQAPLDVRSSDTVWYEVHGKDETAEKQLLADFARQLAAGVQAAMRQASSVVKVVHYSPVSS